jgi:hypothetical protein
MARTDAHPLRIAECIRIFRGTRVILDTDLAILYGVSVKRLNEQVRRNRARFPQDFAFPLDNHELANLKSQFATSSWGGKRKPPRAFTEHGAIMAATVLNSARAIEVSVYVVRAFVQMRETLASNKQLATRLNELEARLERRIDGHDRAIDEILGAIRQLMTPPEPPRRRGIGFLAPDQ